MPVVILPGLNRLKAWTMSTLAPFENYVIG